MPLHSAGILLYRQHDGRLELFLAPVSYTHLTLPTSDLV